MPTVIYTFTNPQDRVEKKKLEERLARLLALNLNVGDLICTTRKDMAKGGEGEGVVIAINREDGYVDLKIEKNIGPKIYTRVPPFSITRRNQESP